MLAMLEKMTEVGLATAMANHTRAQVWMDRRHPGSALGSGLTPLDGNSSNQGLALDVCYFSDMIESLWGFKQALLHVRALMAMLKIGSLTTYLEATELLATVMASTLRSSRDALIQRVRWLVCCPPLCRSSRASCQALPCAHTRLTRADAPFNARSVFSPRQPSGAQRRPLQLC